MLLLINVRMKLLAVSTIRNLALFAKHCRVRKFVLLQYRKTPLISTYLFSGLATVQVLLFGGRTYFQGA